jgi:transcriptional regulator with XRE-family HTH domain
MNASQTIDLRNRIIGILVKRARLQAGKSQQECAEVLGCSPFMFSQYEQGLRGLALPQLEVLAYTLDVPLDSLWNEDHAHPEEESPTDLPLTQLMLIRRKELAIRFRQCRSEAGMTQAGMGELLGRSAYIISQYEHGRRDIPLAEMEVALQQCQGSIEDFLDTDTIPLGEADQARHMLLKLNELPPDVRDFVLRPTNALYLRIAMLLSSLKADSLRQIAESLLEITY